MHQSIRGSRTVIRLKRRNPYFAIWAVAALVTVACTKTDAPKVSIGAPTPPVERMPDPAVPKGPVVPTPAPGQANDHSSPAFKAGGKPDPNK
jgi:hypothetical protein